MAIDKNRSTAPAALREDKERIAYNTGTSCRLEIAHFFDAIKQDMPVNIWDSTDALKLMKIIDRIYTNR